MKCLEPRKPKPRSICMSITYETKADDTFERSLLRVVVTDARQNESWLSKRDMILNVTRDAVVSYHNDKCDRWEWRGCEYGPINQHVTNSEFCRVVIALPIISGVSVRVSERRGIGGLQAFHKNSHSKCNVKPSVQCSLAGLMYLWGQGMASSLGQNRDHARSGRDRPVCTSII